MARRGEARRGWARQGKARVLFEFEKKYNDRKEYKMQTNLRKHSDVEHLCDLLKTVEKGKEVTRDQLCLRLNVGEFELISSKVSEAVNRMRNKYGKVFKLIRGGNLRYLLDEEIVRDTSDVKKANKSAKRQMVKYTCVDRNELTPTGKTLLDANIMRASIQEAVTGENSTPIIESAIRKQDQKQLTIGQTLDLFK